MIANSLHEPDALTILFVIRAYPPDVAGGGARSVSELAQTLARRGHHIHVARLAPRQKVIEYKIEAEQEAKRTGVTIHVLPLRNIYWPFDWQKRKAWMRMVWHLLDINNFWAARDIEKLVKAIKPDIVNTSIITGFSTSIFKAAKKSGAKLVHTMRDYYLMCGQSAMYRDGHNCATICDQCKPFAEARRHAATEVDLFLSNSQFVAERHRALGAIPKEKPYFTQWNINPAPQEFGKASRTAGITFGYIGRLDPAKGVDGLLEAADRLKNQNDWELLIAGDGDEKWVKAIKTKYSSNPRIKFLGWQKSDDFYRRINWLICPSTYHEPLPRVIYEGFAFKLPVIAASTGGIPEIVTREVEGFLYEGGDVDTLADAMSEALEMSEERYDQLSTNAYRRSLQFLPSSVADTYESRVRELLRTGVSN